MLRMFKPIFGSGNAAVLYSGFCVAKFIIDIGVKVVYAEDLINNQCHWTKLVPGDLIDT